MNDLDRNINAAVLRALLAAKGPMPEAALTQHIRNLHPNVAFTEEDLLKRIHKLKAANVICEINDDVTGTSWDLTVRGKGRAQQLDANRI